MDNKSETNDGAAGTLPTRLEIAAKRAIHDPTPTTSSFLDRVRNGKRPAHGEALPELNEGKQVQFTPTTVAAIVWNFGREMCSADDLAQLQELQAKMEATLEESGRWSLGNVTATIHRQRDQAISDALEGKGFSDEIQSSSREAVAGEFRNRLQALEAMRLKITHEQIVPIAKPILERFERDVEESLRCTETGDRATCLGYGLEYQPSLLWKAIAAIAVRYQARVRLPASHAWTTPRTLLEGIISI